uniref:At4g15545-like C-terminal domain-containing protein n=1 Tax=Aegilops tauschii subsp. strangulata TaxID=200361 RepID=A0A453FLF1_AEGTS
PSRPMTQTPSAHAAAAPATAPPAEGAGLSEAIVAALPPDPYDQLEVARKITAVAVAARASRLEHEAARLRQKLADKDRLAAELADRAEELDQALRDADARLRAVLDDNAKLVKERDSLVQTSRKLARDLAKVTLETFKRHLMQSLGDDNSSSQETVDIRTCEQSVAKASSWRVARPFEQKLTITHMTPRLIADPAPKQRSSSAASARRYSTAVSPKLTSAATSPRLEGHMAMSAWLPSSKMSSAANSPPRGHSVSGRTTRIDGKEFFRQARSRLSYEQFAAFLANIKELNAHRQSQEVTGNGRRTRSSAQKTRTSSSPFRACLAVA